MSQQPYVQPQFVVMPQSHSQSNTLGVFGFFISFIGLFVPTGIVSLIGLILSLAAIGRSPRGFAAMGVILGLLGTVLWLVVMLLALILGLVALVAVGVAVAVGFILIQPEVVEVTTDMVNIAIATEEYQQDHGELPDSASDLTLSFAVTTDPWGATYVLVPAEREPFYDIISGGPDGEFATEDDVSLSSLDQTWKKALEEYGEKAEEFGQKLERLDRSGRGGCGIKIGGSDHEFKKDYEAEAVREIRAALKSLGLDEEEDEPQ